jgi:glyoxylase-like metal-dependent hydrolase (beta-lactamase superfamily II)
MQEIAKNVYRISEGRSNCYLLSGDDLVLVDTGMPGDEKHILAGIAEIGRSPEELRHILITHAHMDHMGSVAAIIKASGARVVASVREVDYIEGLKKTWTMGREGAGGKLFKAVLFLMENFFVRYEPAGVDIRCAGGEFLDCFGGIRVIDAPGHSPGSLVYYVPSARILLTGDALSGVPELKLPPRPGCADYAAALQTVHRLAELDFDLCLFGHGEPLLREASQAVRRLASSARRSAGGTA